MVRCLPVLQLLYSLSAVFSGKIYYACHSLYINCSLMCKAISIDSHQTKPKVYTAGQSCQNTKNEMNQSEQEAKSHDPCQAREKKRLSCQRAGPCTPLDEMHEKMLFSWPIRFKGLQIFSRPCHRLHVFSSLTKVQC